MATKKYLSLEEAAQLLGIKTEEVIRLRERGDLRGFADRGTWKFKSDDVEEAKRRRSPDSNPDVPLFSGDDSTPSGSALEEDDELGRQATIIRKGGSTSDSDVRLLMNEDLRGQLTGSSHEMPILKPGSDSDVRLVGASTEKPTLLSGSDSDVKLIKPKTGDKTNGKKDSDSDVRLATPAGSGLRLAQSDSDVRLAGPVAAPGSDSDVKLVEGSQRTDATASPMGNVFDLDAGDSVLLDDESGVSMENDSGIRLSGDSGIRLAGDSGIQLQQPADSGILLERAGESGFPLGGADDSAITLSDDSGVKVTGSGKLAGRSSPRLPRAPLSADDDPLSMTAPLVLKGEESRRTDPEVPLLAASDDDDDMMPKLKLAGDPPTDAETSVVMLDDDDDLDATVTSMPRKKGKNLNETDLEEEGYDLGDSGDTAAEEFESLDDEEEGSEDLEVFETEDSDFDESFSEGASAADFAVPGGSRIAISTEKEWETWVVVVTLLSTVLMGCGAVAASDLLRVVWASGGPTVPGGLIDSIGGMLFK